MAAQDAASPATSSGAAFPWILEHLLAYPGTYELPLRTMYTLNCASLNQQPQSVVPAQIPGNAFLQTTTLSLEEQQQVNTANAAAQLRANLMTHISQLSAQPTSLPPSFITSFVRKCFPPGLAQVDFPQALTAMDYLKDLEARRRSEILAVMQKLDINREDLSDRENLAQKYPAVLAWLERVEDKEKKLETIYSQIYVGLRRWTLVNEMSLLPFNKANCIAMLNTLYPPTGMASSQFVQPTAQLTAAILSEQRNAFFRYITAVEKKGTGILSSLMRQHKRTGDETGWPSLRESLDAYLTMANTVIDECHEVIGRMLSPTSPTFSCVDDELSATRKTDSGLSFSSSSSDRVSNRSSGQSHLTRPSTSSSFSTGAGSHSRQASKDKPPPSPVLEMNPPSPKPAGSTLERIARELRRIRSKSSVREPSQVRPPTSQGTQSDPHGAEVDQIPAIPGRGLRLRRSLKKMRSSSALRERDANAARPGSRTDDHLAKDVPAFDADEMRLRRQAWEASQHK